VREYFGEWASGIVWSLGFVVWDFMSRAVFLDRDGTIIEDKDYLSDPDQVVLIPGAAEALKRLQDAGFKLFIVTNQSGIGRGYFTMADVECVNRRLEELLAKHGVRIEKIYVAPEAPERPSRGRKPSPQFLFDTHDDFGVDLSKSFMIGDKLSDLECGWNAGVKKSILVRTGYGAEQEQESKGKLDRAVTTQNLVEAAVWILSTVATGDNVRHSAVQRLVRLLQTPVRSPLFRVGKHWRLYVSGDGVHAACAGEFDKFIPWSELVSVRNDIIRGRHGEPIGIPQEQKESILRQIRSEWARHYPDACRQDEDRARREGRFLLFAVAPLMLMLGAALSGLDHELHRDRAFRDALREVFITNLHWYVLIGIGSSALFWLVVKGNAYFRERKRVATRSGNFIG